MRNRYLLAGASCLAIAICGEATAQTTSNQKSAEAAGSSGAPTVSEVIVTASRRSESITKVPTAVSAYSGTKLREAQITSLSDLAAITPNVQIKAYQANADINIRGIGNGNFSQAGGDPGVAVQSDGVYLGQASLALSTLLDVNRVEILRGPQGTLYGSGSLGGTIRYVQNAPDPSGFDAKVEAGVSTTAPHGTGRDE